MWAVSGDLSLCVDMLLRAINLGDSGFLLYRLHPDAEIGGALSWRIVHETVNQCHYFNCPYQLGHGTNGDTVRAVSCGVVM